MPEYTVTATCAVVAVISLELFVVRSGVLRQRAYWITMAIVLSFQVAVDGWLTKRSAPIVLYRSSATTGIRMPWHIPIEDFLFGFSLATLVVVLWQRQSSA